MIVLVHIGVHIALSHEKGFWYAFLVSSSLGCWESAVLPVEQALEMSLHMSQVSSPLDHLTALDPALKLRYHTESASLVATVCVLA